MDVLNVGRVLGVIMLVAGMMGVQVFAQAPASADASLINLMQQLLENQQHLMGRLEAVEERLGGAEERQEALGELVRSKRFAGWTGGFGTRDVHQAESDGLLLVFTGGQSPPHVDVMTGRQDGMSICARVGAYESALCPVRAGDYWRVVPNNNGSGVTIRWLAVAR